MDHLLLDLHGTPSNHEDALGLMEHKFDDLLGELPGDWKVERSQTAWRGEQTLDAFELQVGLSRCVADPGDVRWILAWSAHPAITHQSSWTALLTTITAMFLTLVAAKTAGLGVLVLVAPPIVGLLTWHSMVRIIRARLPDPTQHHAKVAAWVLDKVGTMTDVTVRDAPNTAS